MLYVMSAQDQALEMSVGFRHGNIYDTESIKPKGLLSFVPSSS